jgi:hypothetical protein
MRSKYGQGPHQWTVHTHKRGGGFNENSILLAALWIGWGEGKNSLLDYIYLYVAQWGVGRRKRGEFPALLLSTCAGQNRPERVKYARGHGGRGEFWPEGGGGKIWPASGEGVKKYQNFMINKPLRPPSFWGMDLGFLIKKFMTVESRVLSSFKTKKCYSLFHKNGHCPVII